MTLIAAVGVLSFAPNGSAATVYGGTTSVALDSTTVTVLTGLGFTIAPVAPATLTGLTATFPITGGDTTMMIDHSGGLALTKGSVTADIQNFVINTTSNKLTGDVVAGGMTTSGVTLFDIGSAGALTLDASLAGTLASAYSITNLTGAAIGTATVSPTLTAATPEPATLSLAAFGLIAAGLVGLRNRKFNKS